MNQPEHIKVRDSPAIALQLIYMHLQVTDHGACLECWHKSDAQRISAIANKVTGNIR